MPYPDDMNWPLYDATIGSAGGDSVHNPKEFEHITLSECDDCRELLLINEYGLCKMCNEAAEAYAESLVKAYEHQKLQLRVPSNPQTYEDKGEAL